ncbi:MAG TPA: O-antigen ligase family protein, partial [Tepidisphaeraceae bacterium]|nr:O-antigen ligase family protein [Tepidisphaeraceae bacterium]
MIALGQALAVVTTGGTSATSQIGHFIEFLATPAAWAAIALFGVLAAAAMQSKGARWGAIALAMYFSTIAAPSQNALFGTELGAGPIAFPFLFTIARPLTLAFLAVALVPAIFSGKGWRSRVLLASSIAFLLLEIGMSIRFVYADNMARGMAGAALFGLVFMVFAVGCSRWMQEMPDVLGGLRAIMGSALLLILVTFAQLALRPGAVITHGRLMSTTGNPQHLALVIGASLPALCYLAVRKGEGKPWRVLSIAVLAICVVFLLWSGSRTGVLMALVAVTLQFRRRLGRFALLAIAVSAVALIVMSLLPRSEEVLSRLTSTENTRIVWWSAWDVFLRHPLIGYIPPGLDTAYVENSYLSAAVEMGFIGITLICVLVLALLRTMWQMGRSRSSLGD